MGDPLKMVVRTGEDHRSKHSLLSYGVAIFASGLVLFLAGLMLTADLAAFFGTELITVGMTMIAVFIMQDGTR